MDQMNVSITDKLAGYVRKKVKSGCYNNASEVVRDALRVVASIESIERGNYRDYEGQKGLEALAGSVRARGRRLLKQRVSDK